jgi:hypothetical protein
VEGFVKLRWVRHYEAAPAHELRQQVVNNRICLESLESVSNYSRIVVSQQLKKG